MPIFKLNNPPLTSQKSITESKQPEVDRHVVGNNSEDETMTTTRNINNKNTNSYGKPERNAFNGDLLETLIEREIREQREREKEVAAMRSHVLLRATAKVQPETQHSRDHQATPNGHDEVACREKAASSTANGVIIDGEPDKPRLSSVPTGQLSENEEDLHVVKPGGVNVDGHEAMSVINPAERLIYRELLEQQLREEELRRHWVEMGLELGQSQPDEDDDNDDQSDVIPNSKQFATTTNGSNGMEWVTKDDGAPGEKRSVADMRLISDVTSACVDVGPNDSEEAPRSVRKVQPLADDESGSVHAAIPLFEPVGETVMEREMRAVREREEALRRLRGQMTSPRGSDDEARSSSSMSIDVDVKPEIHVFQRSTSDASDAGTASGYSNKESLAEGSTPNSEALNRAVDRQISKRFAESRLKTELSRQRQRELDMRQLGLINTISEERTGEPEPLNYTEVLVTPAASAATAAPRRASAAELVMRWTSLTAGANNSDLEAPLETTEEQTLAVDEDEQPMSEEKQFVQENTAVVESRSVTTSPAAVSDAAAVEALYAATYPAAVSDFEIAEEQPAATLPVAAPDATAEREMTTTSVSPQSRREIPLVFQVYSYPMKSVGDDLDGAHPALSKKLSPVARLEEEVAQFRRREDEHRALHQSISRLNSSSGEKTPPPVDLKVNVITEVNRIENEPKTESTKISLLQQQQPETEVTSSTDKLNQQQKSTSSLIDDSVITVSKPTVVDDETNTIGETPVPEVTSSVVDSAEAFNEPYEVDGVRLVNVQSKQQEEPDMMSSVSQASRRRLALIDQWEKMIARRD